MTDAPADKFLISVPQQKLDDLKAELIATRWPADMNKDDIDKDTSAGYMRELVDYWINEFNWRGAEAALNEFDHYRVIIDSVPIHFIKEPGQGPAPIPLLLSYGSPSSFREWTTIIKQLADPASYGGDPADAFDVIVPSLAGFGFSAPITKPDMNFWNMAELWHKLMTEHFGFEEYAAGGSDNGAVVVSQLGHRYAAEVYGIWLTRAIRLDLFQGERPRDRNADFMVPDYVPDQVQDGLLDAPNHSYGLADSPVRMLAWMLERWTTVNESAGDMQCSPLREHLLTDATIGWMNDAITNSIRTHANSNQHPWVPSHGRKPIVETPLGVTFLGYENPPGVSTEDRVHTFLDGPDVKEWYNPIYINAHESGSPWENRDAVIEDIRATFRGLR